MVVSTQVRLQPARLRGQREVYSAVVLVILFFFVGLDILRQRVEVVASNVAKRSTIRLVHEKEPPSVCLVANDCLRCRRRRRMDDPADIQFPRR